MKSKVWFSVVALLMIFSMVLTACGPEAATPVPPTATTGTTAPADPTATTGTTAPADPTATTAAPAEPTTGGASTGIPGVLRFSMGSEPENIDPQQMSFVGEIGVGELVFEGLLKLDNDLNPVPAAAESMEVSPDGLKYTVKVRQGLKYSDGQPLNARNFEYAWKRLFDPRVPNKQYSFVAYDIAGAEEADSTDPADAAAVEAAMNNVGVKALDDYTIEFTLKNAASYFPYILTLWTGWPSRQDLVEAGGDEWTKDPTGKYYVGNGPFILSEYKGEQGINFKANPNYRLGAPKLQELRGIVINDTAVAFQSYRKGELDVLNIAAEDYATSKADPQLSSELLDVAGSCNFYLGFNNKLPPFDNVKVRQAFAQALDRDDFVQNVEQGLAAPALSFIPPDRPGHAPDIQTWKFNPEAAKATLAEAGFADGSALPPLKISYSNRPRTKARMEWIQNQLLTNLNVTVELEPVEPTAFTALLKEQSTVPQMYLLGWCQDYPDPQNWLTLVFHSSSTVSHTGWANEEFDRLVRQADVEKDQDKRLDLYHQAHEILVQDAPVVFLFFDVNPWLIKSYVKGAKEFANPQDHLVPGIANIMEMEVTP
jgi:oligopeptide transport system substrate-binding protein